MRKENASGSSFLPASSGPLKAYPEPGKLTGRFRAGDFQRFNPDCLIAVRSHHSYKGVKGIIAALGNNGNRTIRHIFNKSGYAGLPCTVNDKVTVPDTLDPAFCTCRDPHHGDENCASPN